ncbi:ABC transporter substrate-binding protein [Tessaracoccus aquimaris]|uniref:ABC transporter substrate-binding protein n=1 Tax=Tessaracoccus aquimaris TaxID=1332264 RepID=A0A1Q2CP97_9ACTN|nr:extracellular solute-binding protein [Tessaracoccus aquimaris]AQP47948.1 ABC transporter substrate-binding protein [Tessaracoccus aquimaris]
MFGYKKVLAVASAAAMALGLAACGGSGDGADGAGDGKSLTIWQLTLDGDQATAWDALVKGFEAENPGVKVTTENRAVDPHKDALRQAAGTDSVPDIYRYWGGPGLGGELIKANMSLDITKYYDEYKWADSLTSVAVARSELYGGHNGVAFQESSEAIYYNKALFEKAGITELPTTYEELLAAAEKLKAAGITPMEMGGTVNWHVMRLLDALIETECGAEIADKLNQGDGNWGTEPCVTDAFVELKKWGDDYLNQGYMAISQDDSSQLFFTGQAAMALEGDWFGPQAVNGGMSADDFGIFAFPTGTGRIYGFGELLYVTQASKNPDLAAKFLDYMISEDGQAKLGSAFSVISANKNVAPPADAVLANEWSELVSQATGSYLNNDQNFSTAETGEYWRVQNSVLTGSISPEDAGKTFQQWRDANG